jgi:hypothetical protein
MLECACGVMGTPNLVPSTERGVNAVEGGKLVGGAGFTDLPGPFRYCNQPSLSLERGTLGVWLFVPAGC